MTEFWARNGNSSTYGSFYGAIQVSSQYGSCPPPEQKIQEIKVKAVMHLWPRLEITYSHFPHVLLVIWASPDSMCKGTGYQRCRLLVDILVVDYPISPEKQHHFPRYPAQGGNVLYLKERRC